MTARDGAGDAPALLESHEHGGAQSKVLQGFLYEFGYSSQGSSQGGMPSKDSDFYDFCMHQTSQTRRSWQWAKALSPYIMGSSLVMLFSCRQWAFPADAKTIKGGVAAALIANMPVFWHGWRTRSGWADSPIAMSLLQCGMFVAVMTTIIFSSWNGENTIQQHRTFLLCFNNVLTLFTFVGHVPFAFYVLCVGLAGATWVAFHFITGCLDSVKCVYGAIVCAFCLIAGAQRRATAWKDFKATRDLEHTFDDVRDTLNNVVSALLTNSCKCDVEGAILTSTAEFQQLVGDSGPNLMHALSCSTEEQGRVLSFLSAVAKKGNNTMLTMKMKFRPAHADGESDLEVTGIPLQDRNGKVIVFVGLQTSTPPPRTAVSPTPTAADEQLPIDDAAAPAAGAAASAAEAAAGEAADFPEVSPTESALTPCSPSDETEAGTASMSTADLSPGTPRLPRRRASSRCMVPEFRETPEDGVRTLVAAAMRKFNSKAGRCCSWHMQAARISKVVSGIAEGPCQPMFSSHKGWQCTHCLCLNTMQNDTADVPKCKTCEDGWQFVQASDDA